ncbi:MAG: sensor domain-containing diguanylate cyclase [Acidimicrobiales bacterium]
MIAPKKPDNEAERLAELRSLGLLDTEPQERFNRVTRLTQRLLNVPTAVITLVDEDRNSYLSRQGLDNTGASREDSFCAHAILGPDIMQVPDATKDERFFDNPFVIGKPGIRSYAGCPIAGPNGSTLGTLCVFDSQPRVLSAEDLQSVRDLADMVEGEIAALFMTVSDELTGVGNRRGFELSASSLLEVCRHRKVRATLLFFDLDEFKSINDTFGHETGDEALVEFTKLLQTTFRNSDIIARYGGDEFIVLLADTGDPRLALERLRAFLVSRNSHPSSGYPLAFSVGTSVLEPNGEESLEQLIEQADASMYEMKRKHQGTA